MKTNLTIKHIEEKEKQTGGVYWKLETTQGSMSCFENDVIEDLMQNINNNISVDVFESKDGKYKNIRKFNGIVRNEFAGARVVSEPAKKEAVSYKPATEKGTSFYVSYAKDIFIEMISNARSQDLKAESVMTKATELVKQARKELE